jgi:hypothetical protein
MARPTRALFHVPVADILARVEARRTTTSSRIDKARNVKPRSRPLSLEGESRTTRTVAEKS